jgi:hypothetical protein
MIKQSLIQPPNGLFLPPIASPKAKYILIRSFRQSDYLLAPEYYHAADT